MTRQANRTRKAETGERRSRQAPAMANPHGMPHAGIMSHSPMIVPHDWPNRDKSRIIRASGVDFHVQEWGEGPTILLIHGTGASTHSFAALAPLLATEAHVIAIDLPGHAFSETDRSDLFTLPGMARAIASLMKQLGADPVLAVGHSAGAAILIRLALDHAINPAAIIALNGAILPLHPFSHPFVSLMAKFLAANPFVPWFFSKQADGATVDKLLKDTGSKVPEDSRACYRRLLQSRRHVAAALRMMAHWDLETLARDLPSLQTKLVLIAGEADRTIPPDSSDAVARVVPTAHVHRLPRLGHLAHEENPELIAGLILSLIPAADNHKATPS